MKKILGITFGGLQQKTIRLVVIMLLIAIGFFIAAAAYQAKRLSGIVDKAGDEQQAAITAISQETMHLIADRSLQTIVSLQSEIADSDFAEVINYIYVMQNMAEGVLESKDILQPLEINPPDPSLDGTPNAHVLCEEGVDYTKSKYVGLMANLVSPLLAMYSNSEKISSCYIGLEDGTHMSIDTNTKNRYDENGSLIPFPVRQRPWYRGAYDSDGLYFTGLEKDAFSGQIGICCSAPIHENGKIVGVVGADLILDNMTDFVDTGEDNGSLSFVINENGDVILAPDENDLFEVNIADEAQDLREIGNEELAGLINQAQKEKTPSVLVTVNGKEYYMAGAPMPSVGWAIIMAIEKDRTEKPTQQLLAELDKINAASQAVYHEGSARTVKRIFALIAVILLLGGIAALFAANRIVKPIEQMTRNIVESSQTGKLFEMKDIYKTDDEIEILAEAFDDLSKKTKKYIEDITRITQEKERISTELDLARKIQADMLPYIYPAFPDRPEFDIYATMNPAKEVGGDFYDFFLIDDDHLAMVVADVSGKGVPAALFMMMSKILINNFAMMGGSPARVLEQTNHAICQNNEEQMFITAWLGILEISTGKIIAANAGHEYPILRKADGDFEIFKDKHGFVLGAFESMKYKDYEMTLDKGGFLFLYTDGVPEATNSSEEIFGVKRLIQALNTRKGSGPVETLTSIKMSVNEFVGDADQFDDLTMLGITLL